MRAAAILGPGVSEKALSRFHGADVPIAIVDSPQPGYDCVLVFGGDGTVHRHLPALLQTEAPLLVVPTGSGNDFARALGLGTQEAALSAWKRFSTGEGNVRRIDVGVITPLQGEAARLRAELQEIAKSRFLAPSSPAARGGTRNDNPGAPYGAAEAAPFHPIAKAEQAAESEAGNSKLETGNFFFVCVAGAGLDAAVNRIANRMPRWLRGAGGYILAVAPALLGFHSQRFTLEVLAGNPGGRCVSEPAMMAVFGNAPSYGHGMRIAPRADLADGKLDVCLVRRLGKLRLLRLFPVVFSGAHLGMREVEYFQAAAVRLSTQTPLDIYADGEFVCRTPAEIRVVPRRLAVVVP